MLNFLPKYPYGIIPIVPDNIDLAKFPRFKEKVTTDGEYFYTPENIQRGSSDYKPTMLEKLDQSAARLPILVEGDVGWSAVRFDSLHVRVTLVDPGYTDPAEREATVVLQHLTGLKCTDILSGEELQITNNKIQLTIPAGVFRIIDIENSATDSIGWPGQITGTQNEIKDKLLQTNEDNGFAIYPNPGNGKFNLSFLKDLNFSKVSYSIFNSTGVCVLSSDTHIGKELKVDISGSLTGIYYCVVNSADGIMYGKYLLTH
jgi:hypothetical protein